MSVAVAACAAAGVFLVVIGAPRLPLADRLERYLRPARPAPEVDVAASPAEAAGLPWTTAQLRLRRGGAAVGGAIVGLLVAQGDLLVSGPSRSAPALAVLGGAAGALLFSMRLSTRRQQRARRLRHELPVAAEAIALHVMAGESVVTSITRFVDEARGVAADELSVVLTEIGAGEALADALHRAARRTVEPEAGRLYSALGYAHVTGGRLGLGLTDLAVDYRASLARELATEGGRRALAVYGPVLGLMVPITLLFLLFPTIDGLRRLAP